MIKHLILLTCLLSVLSCEDITNVYEETTGSIHGNVVLSSELQGNDISLEYIFIQIPGSSVSAYTDENGNFMLFNIPVGTYKVTATHRNYGRIYGEVENVTVSSGETTTLNNLVLQDQYQFENIYNIENLTVVDSMGNNHYFSQSNMLINYRTNKIKGRVIKRFYNYPYEQGIDTTLSITINNIRHTINSNTKGVFSFNFNLMQLSTEISVWIGDVNQPPQEDDQYYTTNAYYLPNNIRINIDLDWDSYSIGGVGGGDAGDLDIHLISHQDNDSCWYNNTNPDWGIKDFIYDNPNLYDFVNEYGSSWGDEHLDIDYASQGNYTLKIYYFSNASDPTKKIRPDVRIYLGNNYNYYTSPTDMSVGDVWTVADITIPTSKVKLINKIDKNPDYIKKKISKKIVNK